MVNYHLKNSVVLHGTLHGFREGQGTGTDTLEAKMEQNMASHTVNLDSHSISNGHGVLNSLKCRMVESGIIS